MEKEIKLKANGFLTLFIALFMLFAPLGLIFYHQTWSLGIYILLPILGIFWLTGLFIIQPNQTSVLTFFGKYQGTVKSNGYFWLNPFYTIKKVSLRVRNLESDVIKVNDLQGNPILISAIDKINHSHAVEISDRLLLVGIEVIEARISNLSYSPGIAGAMLLRQQATAIVAARQKIVEGAVGMVKLVLDQLKDQDIISLDNEEKASRVGNLLVVLCADESARPVINTGSIN